MKTYLYAALFIVTVYINIYYIILLYHALSNPTSQKVVINFIEQQLW